MLCPARKVAVRRGLISLLPAKPCLHAREGRQWQATRPLDGTLVLQLTNGDDGTDGAVKWSQLAMMERRLALQVHSGQLQGR